MTWRPMTQLAAAKIVNIAKTVTNTAATRPIQRSKRVTNLESRKVIKVASAIGTRTERPKYSAATTNAISNSAQIPVSAAEGVNDGVRVRMRFNCLVSFDRRG